MEIIVSIDDTDNMESKGTGELAQEIANTIEKNKWGEVSKITRHQLLVHEDIPYTSHNSAMAFEADIDDNCLQTIIEFSIDYLKKESAAESDPGLCVVVLDDLLSEEKLIEFGKKAKCEVLSKEEAYNLAKTLKIHLSEHGGTGQGVIGALAGAGLRLSGNDGRFKGNHIVSTRDNIMAVGEIRVSTGIDVVKTLDGEMLKDNERIFLKDKIKTVLLQYQEVLLVEPIEGQKGEILWQNCSKQKLRNY
ncbi:hypothetical protein [Natronincola ferrireducens]|uniref:tRNA(Ile2) 2-agmatinylcytidine synthetase n=1 Tax=Natronincola ferrireducens TaxID=393762 RepID=A0A1G8ZPI4_9FIRM|nr:hypothetical protein [Natronincola ferrireducens]SDK16923.1 tRNA(Ile2) 2-agmatinylcytidine synthetase [Natronincola ferrireducens]